MIESSIIVIPARLASTRLPGKVLADIGGRPMLQHVWQAACGAGAQRVLIATDHVQIQSVAQKFGAECLLTAANHMSGSDRIAEIVEQLELDDSQLLVNLQGDEPEMPAVCLQQVAELLAEDPQASVATLYWPITEAAELDDPSVVKVVSDQQSRALYFSRAPIPHQRGAADAQTALADGSVYKRHLGLYAYRASALRAFTAAPADALELSEGLEQLRFLGLGQTIALARAARAIPAGIDTPADLERVRKIL